jgi:hypothetical protein
VDAKVGTLTAHMGWELSRGAQRRSLIVIRGVHSLLLLHLKRLQGLRLGDRNPVPGIHIEGAHEHLALYFAVQLIHPILLGAGAEAADGSLFIISLAQEVQGPTRYFLLGKHLQTQWPQANVPQNSFSGEIRVTHSTQCSFIGRAFIILGHP